MTHKFEISQIQTVGPHKTKHSSFFNTERCGGKHEEKHEEIYEACQLQCHDSYLDSNLNYNKKK